MKTFADRVNEIDHKLRGKFNDDNTYFNDCYILDNIYVICGRYHDVIAKFDHKPSDKEINNAIVRRFSMNRAYLIK